MHFGLFLTRRATFLSSISSMHFVFVASYPSLFTSSHKKILFSATTLGHLCGFGFVCPFSFLYVYLVCVSVCVIYLVISPVFLCIHVTLLAMGLLFWPQPALESHLHPSQSPGPPWGLSSVLSPSPYLQTHSSFSPGSTSGLWPGALGNGWLCRW